MIHVLVAHVNSNKLMKYLIFQNLQINLNKIITGSLPIRAHHVCQSATCPLFFWILLYMQSICMGVDALCFMY